MSANVTISIDEKEISVPAGQKLLWAALENGIYIPHLCAEKEALFPTASCRLCFVEVEGKKGPVTACTESVYEGMVVKTRSEQVDDLVRSGFELIMSRHRLDCKNCPGNGKCELQKIAKERKLPLKPRRIPVMDREYPLDNSKDGILLDPNKCVLCGRCVTACRQEGAAVLNFVHRGIDRMVATFGELPLGETKCTGCGACTEACPVGACSKTA